MLDQLNKALDSAQNELISADIALIEATARQQEAADAASRLVTAVAALSGEKAPAEPPAAAQTESHVPSAQGVGELLPAPAKSIHEMTAEEFEASRKVKQAEEKRAEEQWRSENDPLYHVPCSGCGRTGTLQQTVMTAPSGAQVQMKVCTGCNNQIMG